MRRLSPAVCALATVLAGCTGTSKEGRPPADLTGTWFGSWAGFDDLGYPVGSGFYLDLVQDDDTDLITGTAFSSLAGHGTVTGDADGSRFTLEIAYTGGAVETYSGREEFGTIDNGNYDGTIGGVPYDGDFRMFPAELATSGFDDAPGLVSGRILTGGGTTPVNGATVSIGAGDARQETVTNANGNYSFSFVPGGPRVLVVSANGGQTAYVPLVVDGAVTMPDINLVPASAPATKPVIAFSQAVDGIVTNNSVVFAFGDVTATDADYLVASINGGEYLVPLDGTAFTYALILSRGVNTVIFQAINQVGVTERTALANADVLPQKIRVTLVWDEGDPGDGGASPNDQDLHVFQYPPGSGAGNHASFVDPAGIPGGLLDVDNTFGYGPENFTMATAPAGTYYVAVDFFAGAVTTNDIVRISLNEKTPDEAAYVFGPQNMTTPDGNAGYPVTATTGSWWRVADIVVDASGLATLAPAPNPDTAFALTE